METLEDVRKEFEYLRFNNAVVASFSALIGHGLTERDALLSIIVSLAKQNKHLLDVELRRQLTETTLRRETPDDRR